MPDSTQNLTNEQLTPLLAEASELIISLLKEENRSLKAQGNANTFNAAHMINFILHDESGQPIQSLAALNERVRKVQFNQTQQYLVPVPQQYSEQAQKKLLDALTIQLSAIAAGFQAGSFDYSQPSQPRQTEQVVQRVYYVDGYRHYDYRNDDFWRDMFFIHMLNDWSFHHHSYGPSAPYSSPHNSDSCDEDTLKIILVAVVVLGAAIATVIATAYLYHKLGKTFDEILHAENIIKNGLALSSVGGGAAGGVFMGIALAAALGASGPGLPIFLGICMAVMTSAVSIALVSSVLNKISEKCNRASAIASDSRFKLSTYEKARLTRLGFDLDEVNEAIRELAGCYAKTKEKLFGFSRDRTKLIQQLRDLKSGKIKSDYFHFNHKAFHIIKSSPSYEPPPAYDDMPSVPKAINPPAQNPAWRLFAPAPLPSYEESCQSYNGPPPSAPPLEMIK